MVLIDEESGRQLAREESLPVRGTVGILENLYRRREITDLRESFQRLLDHRAHLDLNLLNRRLRLFELPPLSKVDKGFSGFLKSRRRSLNQVD